MSAALLFCAASISVVHAKKCTHKEADAAETMVDYLDSWDKIENARKQFGHCDDGSIAEGISEATARVLVDHWATLPALGEMIKRNPPMKRFVLWHINSTLNSTDLEQIQRLATTSCPNGLTGLCKDLKKSATGAIAEQLSFPD